MTLNAGDFVMLKVFGTDIQQTGVFPSGSSELLEISILGLFAKASSKEQNLIFIAIDIQVEWE